MPVKHFSFFFLFLVSISFAQQQAENDDIKTIKALLAAQENAWNKGNIDAFMLGYWENEQLVFTGSKGPTYGYTKALERYKKSYPDREAMGALHFDLLFVKQWDESTIQVVGKFTLNRIHDTPTGHFTLLFREIAGDWKIVSDHSS